MSPSLVLTEWERASPNDHPELKDLRVSDDSQASDTIKRLSSSGQLELLELHDGLRIRTTSWVGSLAVGKLSLTILPKIKAIPLLSLLRYAYGFRNLKLHGMTPYALETSPFLDILIHQLAAETRELVSRGLHRDYRRTSEWLVLPRGRIDFRRLVSSAPGLNPGLPCIHVPRSLSTTLNQVLLAGIRLASSLTADLGLRSTLRHVEESMDEVGDPAKDLSINVVENALRNLDRRTKSYRPALTIISLLLGGQSVVIDKPGEQTELPGFLFDMNHFFQALLSKFLKENLSDVRVEDEFSLRGMFRYDPEKNPKKRNSRSMRPDFLLFQKGRAPAVLDAKYRDLWDKDLPREMLYQLTLYALGHKGTQMATILYPSEQVSASEQMIEFSESTTGIRCAHVVLRPVNLDYLEKIATSYPSEETLRARKSYAESLAFG